MATIQEINVLTEDGLRTYTETLVAWIKSKLAVKDGDWPSLRVIQEGTNLKIALLRGETEVSVITIPIAGEGAGIITPTMLAQINQITSGEGLEFFIHNLIDGINILPSAMELGNIYVKDGKLYFPIINPDGNIFNVIEIGKDGIKNITNSGSTDIYVTLDKQFLTLNNPTPTECQEKTEELNQNGLIYFDKSDLSICIYNSDTKELTKYTPDGGYVYSKNSIIEGEEVWNEEPDRMLNNPVDDYLDDSSENPVQNRIINYALSNKVEYQEFSSFTHDTQEDIANLIRQISQVDANILDINDEISQLKNSYNTINSTTIPEILNQIGEIDTQVSTLTPVYDEIEELDEKIQLKLSDIDSWKGKAIDVNYLSDSGFSFDFTTNTLSKLNNTGGIEKIYDDGCYLITSDDKYYVYNASAKELYQIAFNSDITRISSLINEKADLKQVEINFGRIIPVSFMGPVNNAILPKNAYVFDIVTNKIYQTDNQGIINNYNTKLNPIETTVGSEQSFIFAVFDGLDGTDFYLYTSGISPQKIATVSDTQYVTSNEFSSWKGRVIEINDWDESNGMIFSPGRPGVYDPENPSVGDYKFDVDDSQLQIYTDTGWDVIDEGKYIVTYNNEIYFYNADNSELTKLTTNAIEQIYVNGQLVPISRGASGLNTININTTGEVTVNNSDIIIDPIWNPVSFDPENSPGNPGQYTFIVDGNHLYKYDEGWTELTLGNYLLKYSENLNNLLYLLSIDRTDPNDPQTELIQIAKYSDISGETGGGITQIQRSNNTPLTNTNGIVVLPDFVESTNLTSNYYNKSTIDTKLSEYAKLDDIRKGGKAVQVTPITQIGTIKTTTYNYVEGNTTALVLYNGKLYLKVIGGSTVLYYTSWNATANLLSSSNYTDVDLYFSATFDNITFYKRSGQNIIPLSSGNTDNDEDTSEELSNLQLDNNTSIKIVEPSNGTYNNESDLGTYRLTFVNEEAKLWRVSNVDGTNTLVEVPLNKLYVVSYSGNLYLFRRITAQGQKNIFKQIANISDIPKQPILSTEKQKIFVLKHIGETSNSNSVSYELGDVWYNENGEDNSEKIQIYNGFGFDDYTDTLEEGEYIILLDIENNKIYKFNEELVELISIPQDKKEIVFIKVQNTDPETHEVLYYLNPDNGIFKQYNESLASWIAVDSRNIDSSILYIDVNDNELYRYNGNYFVKLITYSSDPQGDPQEDTDIDTLLRSLVSKVTEQYERLNQIKLDISELNSEEYITDVKRLKGYQFGYGGNLITSNFEIAKKGDVKRGSNGLLEECYSGVEYPVCSIWIHQKNSLNKIGTETIELVSSNSFGGSESVTIELKGKEILDDIAQDICDQIAAQGYRKLNWTYEKGKDNQALSKYPGSVCIGGGSDSYPLNRYIKIVPKKFGNISPSSSSDLGLIFNAIGPYVYSSRQAVSAKFKTIDSFNNLVGETLPLTDVITGQCFFLTQNSIKKPYWAVVSNKGIVTWYDANGDPFTTK